ncbi:MAG: HesA/MoeB/ThiF family protein [Desulfohalobiaceae bacterium]|nr:HesA/MoeB/ThiF family protein [Desulfohalobiaceae bacterium]
MQDQRDQLRYQRQMGLPEIGEQGQKRLARSRVFVGGLGGLGSVITTYLCAAGVGSLRIADRDRVEISNLNRQILHWTKDVGRDKTVSAREKLAALNPDAEIETHHLEIGPENAAELVQGCQVIVDGTDNLQTRRVLNRTSLDMDLPFVHGGINGFNGMISTFVPGRSPCFECLFSEFGSPSSPPPVLGSVAGVVGSLQSLEVIKCLLGLMDGLLCGRLLFMQGQTMAFREISLGKNPDCPECRGR